MKTKNLQVATDSSDAREVYTRECTNPTCGFQNGGRIVEKGKVPKDNLDFCIYCGSRVDWYLVYLFTSED